MVVMLLRVAFRLRAWLASAIGWAARKRNATHVYRPTHLITATTCACIAALLLVFHGVPAHAAPKNKGVLIIYQDGSLLRSSIEIADGISRGLEKFSKNRLDLYSEFLDSPRFSNREHYSNAAEFISSKYSKSEIDIVVAIGPEALRFVVQFKERISPLAKVVFGDISERTYQRLKPPANFAGAITEYDIGKSIDLAIALQSEASDIAVFSGSAEFDGYWQNVARSTLGNTYRGLPVRYISGLPLGGMVEQARGFGPRTVLLILTIFEDSVGQKYRPRDAALEIASSAGAPSYGVLSSYVGNGIVGGHIATYESIGNDVAKLIAEVARGGDPGVLQAASHLVADWRQMQRWQLDGADLPKATELLHLSPSVWDEYRWQIIAAALLVLTEAMAIVALIIERRSRLSAEVQARSRLLELVHLNQSATAGALSASIAHELNQPLGAIRSNAEAAEAILRGEAPDLDLIQQILADIRDDDQRAGDIILRLRGMLKKRSEIDWQEFDLNEIVDGAISILRAEATKKQVALSSEQSRGRLPVRADKVHLQQVILNLATNAMDAMAESARGNRKLVFQTVLQGDASVEMSILDTGGGIPKERLDSIFAAFYTTKPNGTGLGLSIARAIVETYGGKIWADNRADGGAVFRFVLPLAQAV